MKQGIKLSLFCLFVGMSIVISCKTKGNKDILEYVKSPENGLKKEVIIGKNIYKIQYKPVAYIVKSERLSGQELLIREKQLDSMVWFNISFSIQDFAASPLKYGINNMVDYNQRLDYYLNKAAADISLVYGMDTLKSYSYWFENNQNLSPEETIVVGFKLKNDRVPEKDLHLAFYDRIFENGIIKTIIRARDLKSVAHF